MGQFTELNQQQLTILCHEFSLGSLHGFRSIAAGTINSNYQIDTDSGRFFLRINEGKEERDVAYEVAVLTHLVNGGVATPLPIEGRDGLRYAEFEGQFVSVFPWQDGHHVESASISDVDCKSIGRELARLHLAGRGMQGMQKGRYTFDAIVQAYEKFADSRDPALARSIAVLGEEIEWLKRRCDERAALPGGLIHADLFPDNVLMRSGNVAALLDFEQACMGTYCYDLAVCINAWCFAKGLVESRAVALIEGYCDVRPMTEAELVGLMLELRASALRFTVTRIRDVHLPAASATGGFDSAGKDFRRFLMRLETWQGRGARGVADLAKAARSA